MMHLITDRFYATVGEASYRITEASLMDRLNTNMNEACVQIEKDCRSDENTCFFYIT